MARRGASIVGRFILPHTMPTRDAAGRATLTTTIGTTATTTATERRIQWQGRVANALAQRELKEEVILECAASWFHRHGFHGASLSDIAGELGITKAALYHYASSKEELLYRLHVRSLQAARAARDDAVASGTDGLDRVARLVYNVVMVMTGTPVESFFMLEPGTLNAAHGEQIEQARRWLKLDLRDLLARGIADGSIAPCDPKLATFFIVGAQNWVGRWHAPDGAWPRETIAAGYADMVRRLLAPAAEGAAGGARPV